MNQIMNLETTKNLNISLFYQSLLDIIVENNIQHLAKQIKIVILTKYSMDECIQPMLDRYRNVSKDRYLSFFKMMKSNFQRHQVNHFPSCHD